jgi:hypothetical protein
VRRARLVRTAESYGPDAPGLASSLRIGDVGLIGPDAPGSAGDGDNKAWSPGRVRRSLLTPSRREGRVAPVEPVWTCSCAFSSRTRGCGCGQHPAFPAPSFRRGAMLRQDSGAIAPRERGAVIRGSSLGMWPAAAPQIVGGTRTHRPEPRLSPVCRRRLLSRPKCSRAAIRAERPGERRQGHIWAVIALSWESVRGRVHGK